MLRVPLVSILPSGERSAMLAGGRYEPRELEPIPDVGSAEAAATPLIRVLLFGATPIPCLRILSFILSLPLLARVAQQAPASHSASYSLGRGRVV